MAKRSQQKWKYLQKRADSYGNQLTLAFKSISFHICTWQVLGGIQAPETSVLNTCCLMLLYLEIHVRLGFILVQGVTLTHPFQVNLSLLAQGCMWWRIMMVNVVSNGSLACHQDLSLTFSSSHYFYVGPRGSANRGRSSGRFHVTD